MSTTTRTETTGETEQPPIARMVSKPEQRLQEAISGYGAQDVQPLVPYAALGGIFNLAFAGFLLAAH